MDTMSQTHIDTFMATSLGIWVQTFSMEPLTFTDLCEGAFLNDVFQQINPQTTPTDIAYTGVATLNDRLKQWITLLDDIQTFFQETLQEFIIGPLPDIVNLCLHPESAQVDVHKALLLLLGCAVHCERKEFFIEKIKTLDIDVQQEIVDAIKQATDSTYFVVASDLQTEDDLSRMLYSHVKRLLQQRREMTSKLADIVVANVNLNGCSNCAISVAPSGLDTNGRDPLAAVNRSLRQQLDEKNLDVAELTEELNDLRQTLQRLKTENSELANEARLSRIYRDELDAYREQATKSDRLQAEVVKLRERLADLEFTKSRIDELRTENHLLLETKQELEYQVVARDQKLTRTAELESELERFKQTIRNIASELEKERCKNQDLVAENIRLKLTTSDCELRLSGLEEQLRQNGQLETSKGGVADSILNQLSEASTNTLLQLELDNKRLRRQLSAATKQAVDSTHEPKTVKTGDRQKLPHLQSSSTSKNEVVVCNGHADSVNKTDDDDCSDADDDVNVSDNHRNQPASKSSRTPDVGRLSSKTSEKLNEMNGASTALDSDDDASVSLDLQQSLERQIRQLRCEVERLGDEKQTVEVERARLAEECSSLRGRITVLESDDRAAAEVTVESSQQRIEDLERQVEELVREKSVDKATVTRLREELSAAGGKQKKTRQAAVARDVKTSSEDQFEIASRRFAPTILEMKMLSTPGGFDCMDTVDGSTGPAHNDQLLKDRLIALERQNAALEEERRSLRQHSTETDASLRAAEASNLQLSTELSTNRGLTSALQSRLDHLESVCSASTHRQAELELGNATINAECDRLRAKIERVESTRSELERAAHESKRRIETLNNELGTAVAARIAAEDKLARMSEQVRHLSDEVERLSRWKSEVETRSISEHDPQPIVVMETTTSSPNLAAATHDDSSTSLEAEMSAELLRSNVRLEAERDRARDELDQLAVELRDAKHDIAVWRTKSEKLMDEATECRRQLTAVEVECFRIESRCNTLADINNKLEIERQMLLNQIQSLMNQVQELLTELISSKDSYATDQKSYLEQLADLRRQKEKLEEKIIEHYKSANSPKKKSKGFGAVLVRKARNVISRGRSKDDQHTSSVSKQHFDDPPEMSQFSPIEAANGGSGGDYLTQHGELRPKSPVTYRRAAGNLDPLETPPLPPARPSRNHYGLWAAHSNLDLTTAGYKSRSLSRVETGGSRSGVGRDPRCRSVVFEDEPITLDQFLSECNRSPKSRRQLLAENQTGNVADAAVGGLDNDTGSSVSSGMNSSCGATNVPAAHQPHQYKQLTSKWTSLLSVFRPSSPSSSSFPSTTTTTDVGDRSHRADSGCQSLSTFYVSSVGQLSTTSSENEQKAIVNSGSATELENDTLSTSLPPTVQPGTKADTESTEHNHSNPQMQVTSALDRLDRLVQVPNAQSSPEDRHNPKTGSVVSERTAHRISPSAYLIHAEVNSTASRNSSDSSSNFVPLRSTSNRSTGSSASSQSTSAGQKVDVDASSRSTSGRSDRLAFGKFSKTVSSKAVEDDSGSNSSSVFRHSQSSTESSLRGKGKFTPAVLDSSGRQHRAGNSSQIVENGQCDDSFSFRESPVCI